MKLGVITTSHLKNGFFINSFGKQEGEGYEYHLLVIGIAMALLVRGAGQWSADRVMTVKL